MRFGHEGLEAGQDVGVFRSDVCRLAGILVEVVEFVTRSVRGCSGALSAQEAARAALPERRSRRFMAERYE